MSFQEVNQEAGGKGDAYTNDTWEGESLSQSKMNNKLNSTNRKSDISKSPSILIKACLRMLDSAS